MIPPLKPGAKLLKDDGPVLQTARLILRPWCSDDIAANTARLSDRGSARYITPARIAFTTEIGEIIHCIEASNEPSKRVARRLGARHDGEVGLFGKPSERWVTSRASWKGQSA